MKMKILIEFFGGVMLTSLILNIVLLILLPFNLILIKFYKKTFHVVFSAVLGAFLLVNLVLLICGIQFRPMVSCVLLGISVLFEAFGLINVLKKRNGIVLFTAFFICILCFSLFSEVEVHRCIDNEECVGEYSSITGVAPTKVRYYKEISPLVMSFDYYCIEDYGVILSDEIDFKNTAPKSVEYNSDYVTNNRGQ